MELKNISEKLGQVCQIYTERFGIRADDDWYLLKIQEELGELSAVHLKLTQRARTENLSRETLEQNLRDEIADVLAMTILFARHQGVDLEKALEKKWFKHLPDQNGPI